MMDDLRFETVRQDVRYGLRLLARAPGFTSLAILTLALGIGASTAVFSLVNTVLLKPLGFFEPQRIVLPEILPPRGLAGFEEYPWSRTGYLLFSEVEHGPFESIGAFKPATFNLTGWGEPQRIDGLLASSGFFQSLGVAPALGRTYSAEEDQAGGSHTVVLGHDVWRQRFSSDPQILGKSIELNGAAYTVVGIMPPGFVFPRAEEMPAIFGFSRQAELWVPLALKPGPPVRGEQSELAVIARLKKDVPLATAQAQMLLFATRGEAMSPAAKGWFNIRLTPLEREEVSGTQRPLLLILSAVLVVLLVACSNVANLVLTRALARQRELMVRTALGAPVGRLARQLVTESLLLALMGGAAGLAIAEACIRLVKAFGPANIPRLQETGIDLRVFAFAGAASLMTGIIFGLTPVFSSLRDNIADALKKGGRVTGSSSAAKLREGLLVFQIALTFVLVITAGLLTRTFMHLYRIDPGFNPERTLSFELTLPDQKYPDQQHIVAVYERILDRLRGLPAVESAAVVEHLPMGGTPESTALRIPDKPTAAHGEVPYANYTMLSTGYFATVQTPILRGRDFLPSDTADSQPVAIINQSMAKRFWPGEDALGKQVTPPIFKNAQTIIGIVADTKHLSLREEPAPEMYVPYTQKVWPSLLTMDVVVRSNLDPTALETSVRAAVTSLDPELPIANVMTLSTIVNNSMTQRRFALLVLTSFAALAMLLAAIGMYGVISYSVFRRVQEIGVRMALGAQRSSIFLMILGEAGRLLLAAFAIGIACSFGVNRTIASFLFGVRPTDPLTFATVSICMSAVVLIACYQPARRAMAIQPMLALRYE